MIVWADQSWVRREVLGSTIKIIRNLLINEIDDEMCWILMIVDIWLQDEMLSPYENIKDLLVEWFV